MKTSLITALIAITTLFACGYLTSCAETGVKVTAAMPWGTLTIKQPARIVPSGK